VLKIEDLSAWLRTAPRSVTTPIRLVVLPDMPDQVVVLSDYGGYAAEVEEAIDAPSVQVRCRAASAQGARDQAHAIDLLLLPRDAPSRRMTLNPGPNAYVVVDAGRVGGPPSYLATDERGRTEYICNYWFKVER
jgi:hypothetical protein